jgi:hypothetical protein
LKIEKKTRSERGSKRGDDEKAWHFAALVGKENLNGVGGERERRRQIKSANSDGNKLGINTQS